MVLAYSTVVSMTKESKSRQSEESAELQALRDGTQQVAQVIGEGTAMINEAQTPAEREAAKKAMQQMIALTGRIAIESADQAAGKPANQSQ